MFKKAATYNNNTDLQEYTETVTAYIKKYIDDVTVTKTITTRANQKPWMRAEVRGLLKHSDQEIKQPSKQKNIFVFVTYTIIQSITSSEMCAMHLTHPSARTPGAVGSQCCGARGTVGGSVPCSRVSPQSWIIPAGAENRTHNLELQVRCSIH